MSAPRFYNYKQITAKFASKSTDCGSAVGGHEIKIGDIVGYCRLGKNSHTHCASCWAKWVEENREADRYEAANHCNSDPRGDW